MWHLATPWLEILARCAIVYTAVLLGLRLSGKREIGQMTPFDLVLILLIANAVQNAMIGNDNSLAGGLVAAGALIALNFSVGRAARKWMGFGRLLKGHASVLINRGVVVEETGGNEAAPATAASVIATEQNAPTSRFTGGSIGSPGGDRLRARAPRASRSG